MGLIGIGAKIKDVMAVSHIRNSLFLSPGEPLTPIPVCKMEAILIHHQASSKNLQKPSHRTIDSLFRLEDKVSFFSALVNCLHS